MVLLRKDTEKQIVHTSTRIKTILRSVFTGNVARRDVIIYVNESDAYKRSEK